MVTWGKTKDGQPYIKMNGKGLSGRGVETAPLTDIHYKENRSRNMMEQFSDAEVIVPDSELGVWFVWIGGQSHYVHLYDNNGKELDVFSWGFEKDKLNPADVRKHIKQKIEELKKDYER